MAFLFSPKARAFSDESLESYLLRVVSENFFDSYEGLSLAIREELHELDFEAHGAFPIDLKRLNVYHAKHNSHFRMRALGLLESLLALPKFELKKLALLRAPWKSNNAVMLHRDGVDIPLKFIRYRSENEIDAIPICPQCLVEEAYIKQSWHVRWVNTCAIHQCKLVHTCPDCQRPINYIENEAVSFCGCGTDLTTLPVEVVDKKTAHLTEVLFLNETKLKNPIFAGTTITERMITLLWYQKRYSNPEDFCLNKVASYFDDWPSNFYKELDCLTESAEVKLIQLFNKTSFSFIYGDLITSVPLGGHASYKLHFVKKALMDYLTILVDENPKTKKANVADLLVSVQEASVILDTPYEQVYRLHQEGILNSAIRLKMNRRVDAHIGVFYLRQVIEYRSSIEKSISSVLVSAW